MSQAGLSYIEHVVSLNVGPKTYFSVHYPLFPAWFLIFTKHPPPNMTEVSKGLRKDFFANSKTCCRGSFFCVVQVHFFTQNVALDIFGMNCNLSFLAIILQIVDTTRHDRTGQI